MKKTNLIFPIVLINSIFIYYLLKPFFIESVDDFLGLFFVVGVIFVALYNLYAYFIYAFFSNKTISTYLYILFLLFLLVPVFLLFYITTR